MKSVVLAPPLVSVMLALAIAAQPLAAEEQPIPILLDTDIGTYIDDAYALGLVIASEELDLRAVTTVANQAADRAWIVCRFLTHLEMRDVPVAYGRGEQPESEIDWQIQYRRHPAVVWDRTIKPAKQTAVELLYEKLKAEPGKLTIIVLGPLTNIGQLIEQHPDCKAWIKRIVLMGGSIERGYEGELGAVAEWNIRSDVKAAQTVFSSGVPLVVAPLDAAGAVLIENDIDRIAQAATPLTYQVQALYELWDKEQPALYDPVAVALAFSDWFCEMKDMHLTVDDKGYTRQGKGKPNARVVISMDADAFVDWVVKRLASHGEQVLPEPPKNISSLVPRGGLPNRVHAFEDYDTDIEKRWWMTGKLETEDVPPEGRGRACRAVLTQDYDAKMGDSRAMYKAVIFNPVPGPPMGKNTRLYFRYKLSGTDTMRVQLFSLSNGYHRYLSLKDLPQNEWREGTVDMTEMRRPDGSGGPLAEDERIDDIQFYIDPRADLLIDEIVLYDAAPADETRPFPKHLLFTGTFDTGRQGREWPGDFEIVLHEKPRTWDAAKSVANEELERPWIRLHLRGQRPLGEKQTALCFDYRLAGGDTIDVELADTETGKRWTKKLQDLKQDEWAVASLAFDTSNAKSDEEGKFPAANELRFILPQGTTLLVDDVLLYEPGAER